MKPPFDILEHTADIGIRAHGRTLAEVYANAARGMLFLIVLPETVKPGEEEIIEVEGHDAVDLLVTWLHEILFRFDARRRAYAEVIVDEVTPWRLRARLRGEPLDLSRHQVQAEIKAVTYHAARVEQQGDEWVVEVLFDV